VRTVVNFCEKLDTQMYMRFAITYCS